MRKLILILFINLILIGNVLALDSLGTFKQNDLVRVTQICSDATWINISSIGLPNSNAAVSNISMSPNGNGEFSYSFNNTNAIGRYDVRGVSDGCEETFAVYFDVTPSGFIGTLGFYFILLVIVGSITGLGFWVKEEWFVVFGGMALIMLGLYSINYGIAGFRDMFMTWGVGLFEIGIGAFLSIEAGLEKMDV